jgi:putative phage-type endonuclease
MATAQAQSFDPIERRTYIGASDVAAICGLDKYRTALDVFNEKLGLTEGFAGNNHTERGNRLEAIAADYYTELTGAKLRRHNEGFTHPQHDFIRGHVDRMVVGEKRIVEIKCPSVAAFRRHQREGLPESYIIQSQIYMGLANVPQLTFCIFCADVWDMATFDIAFDGTIYNALIAQVYEFWTENVLKGIPPTTKADDDKIQLEKTGGTVTFRNDPAFVEAAEAVREAWQLESDAKELKELAKKKMADAVEGEFGIYEGGGVRLYYRETAGRKTFDKDALAKDHPEIDLGKYMKQGKPSSEFRPYFLQSAE